MPTSWCDRRIDELKAENARLLARSERSKSGIIVTDEMVLAAQDTYTRTAEFCPGAAMRAALESALSIRNEPKSH